MLNITYILLRFFYLANSPSWARVSSLSRLHDHSRTNHTSQDPYGRVISPSHRPVPDNVQHSREADLHARGGIRTRILTIRTAADPRLSSPATGIGTFYTVACCCVIRFNDSVTTFVLGIYPRRLKHHFSKVDSASVFRCRNKFIRWAH